MSAKVLFGLAVLLVATSCRETNEKNEKVNSIKTVSSDTGLKWVHYRIGELPPYGYDMAFDSIIRKWDIRYELIIGGCEPNLQQQLQYEKNNPAYFKILSKKFGKDWLKHFYEEVSALEVELQKTGKIPKR
jgi:hypothetical protein